MKPEDPIDENYVPTEEDFAPKQADEKEELRKSIRKGCRFNTIFYSILAVVFAICGMVKFDDISDSKLYLCPLIALMLVSSLTMVFYAIIYERIRQSATAKEMQQHLNLLGSETLFTKLIVIAMSGCIIVAAILGLIDKCPWYVIVLAAIGIAAIIAGLWWLLKNSGKGDARDIDIEKLQALEEQDKS